jgi:very-short-patch-repair endonuclease
MARRLTTTPAHKKLSEALRRKFVRHRNEVRFRIPGLPYELVADIYVPHYGAIVEVDGGCHRELLDDERDRAFLKIRLRTIRIKNYVVERDPDEAANEVIYKLNYQR